MFNDTCADKDTLFMCVFSTPLTATLSKYGSFDVTIQVNHQKSIQTLTIMIPALADANWKRIHSYVLGPQTPSRSPGLRPTARRPAATLSTCTETTLSAGQAAAKSQRCWKTNTHVSLELREGFAKAILQEDHSLPVGPPLGRGVQALADSVVEEGSRGGAMDVAAGQGGDGGRSVYVE